MEELKGKIKEITKKGDKDANSNYSFIVKMEDGKEGWHREKSDPPKWRVGEEVTYIFDTKPKKDGNGTYNTMSNPKTDFKPGGGGNNYKPKTIHQLKQEARGYNISYAKDLAAAKVISVDEIKLNYFEMNAMYDEAIDKLGAGE